MSDSPLLYVLLAVVLLVVAWWIMARVRVAQGSEATLERSSRYVRTLGPGNHIIAWPLERVGVVQDIRELKLDVPLLRAMTRDQVNLQVKLLVFYQIVDSAKASYEVANLKASLQEVIVSVVSTAVAGFSLEELSVEREALANSLPARLDSATEVWGVKITRLDIADLLLPDDLLQAILKRRAAEEEQRTVRVAVQTEKIRALEEAEKDRSIERAAIEVARERALKDEELARLAAEAQRQQGELEQAARHVSVAQLREQTALELEAETLRIQAHEQAELLKRASELRLIEAKKQEADEALAVARVEAEAARAGQLKEHEVVRLQGEKALEEARQQALLNEERLRQTAQAERLALELQREQRMLAARIDQEQAQYALEKTLAEEQQQAALAEERSRQQARAEQLSIELQREQQLMLAKLQQEQLEQQLESERVALSTQRLRVEQEIELRQRAAESVRDQARIAAQGREEAALADVRAAKVLAAALGDASPQFLAYLAAREYVDALRQMSGTGTSQRITSFVPTPNIGEGTTPLAELARQAERLATQVAGQIADHTNGDENARKLSSGSGG